MVMPIVIGNRNSCCYKCQFARCPANQWLQCLAVLSTNFFLMFVMPRTHLFH